MIKKPHYFSILHRHTSFFLDTFTTITKIPSESYFDSEKIHTFSFFKY